MYKGGQYRPFTDAEVKRPHNAAMTLLEKRGIKVFTGTGRGSISSGCLRNYAGRDIFSMWAWSRSSSSSSAFPTDASRDCRSGNAR